MSQHIGINFNLPPHPPLQPNPSKTKNAHHTNNKGGNINASFKERNPFPFQHFPFPSTHVFHKEPSPPLKPRPRVLLPIKNEEKDPFQDSPRKEFNQTSMKKEIAPYEVANLYSHQMDPADSDAAAERTYRANEMCNMLAFIFSELDLDGGLAVNDNDMKNHNQVVDELIQKSPRLAVKKACAAAHAVARIIDPAAEIDPDAASARADADGAAARVYEATAKAKINAESATHTAAGIDKAILALASANINKNTALKANTPNADWNCAVAVAYQTIDTARAELKMAVIDVVNSAAIADAAAKDAVAAAKDADVAAAKANTIALTAKTLLFDASAKALVVDEADENGEILAYALAEKTANAAIANAKAAAILAASAQAAVINALADADIARKVANQASLQFAVFGN